MNEQETEITFLEFVRMIARMNYDGEIMGDGEEFILENDDAISTVNELIPLARALLKTAKRVQPLYNMQGQQIREVTQAEIDWRL